MEEYCNALDTLKSQISTYVEAFENNDGDTEAFESISDPDGELRLPEQIYQTCLRLVNLYEDIDGGERQNPFFINQHTALYLLKAVAIREHHWDALRNGKFIKQDLDTKYIKRNLPK
ncbi:MAG: hypothetical protein ACOCT9_01770 [archaeon]